MTVLQTFEPLGFAKVTTAGTTVTISSIPAGYTDLRIVFGLSFASLNSGSITFNNDSSALYPQAAIYMSTYMATSYSSLRRYPSAASAPYATSISTFDVGANQIILDVFNYTSTATKPFVMSQGGTSPGIGFSGGAYNGTSAITSVTVTASSGLTGAVSVYGIKAS